MSDNIDRSEMAVTPPELYFNRRLFLRAGAAAASALATASIYRWFNPATPLDSVVTDALKVAAPQESQEELTARGWRVDEPSTAERNILNYNNFYEFTTRKEAVAAAAANFRTDGWQLAVEGLVHKPRTFSIDDLHAVSPPQERVYRMRCVEAWSMVIPWVGIPLAHLLDAVEPKEGARFVAFETLLDPERMP